MVKRFVRVMKEDVLAINDAKDALVSAERGARLGREAWVSPFPQIVAARDGHEVRQMCGHRRRRFLPRRVQGLLEEGSELMGGLGRNFQTYCVTALVGALFDGFKKILGLIFVDIQVEVSGHTALSDHGEVGEELIEVHGDDISEKHETESVFRVIVADFNDTLENRRNLHHGDDVFKGAT